MSDRWRSLVDTDLPVIQAPMAGAQDSALTIAASNAGGLGSLPCAMLAPARLEAELRAIQAGTGRPWNANFFCHPMPVREPALEAAWRTLLSRYYEEFGIPSGAGAEGAVRMPFQHETADVLEPFRPPVVSFHFGLPPEALLRRVKQMGSRVLASATTVDEAIWLEHHGADGVIAQGWEAGGHRGSFLVDPGIRSASTLDLVGEIVKRAAVPVIAAGGIHDADSVRKAISAGAVAVQVGTAFLACRESTASPLHRAALKDRAVRGTVVTRIFTGRPARGIVNRLIGDLGPMNEAAPEFPYAALALAPLRAKAEAAGQDGFSPLWCGDGAGSCPELPAQEIVRGLAARIR